jgi:poly(hydroxyalkanoate) granule-associated protein
MAANNRKTEKAGRIETIRQPVEKIWLAGLGALALTEEEGTRLFKSLVKRGQGFEKETRTMLERAVSTTRSAPREAITRLEDGMTETIGGVLQRLGVPTQREINQLTRRVEGLATTLERRPARLRRTTRKPATRRTKAAPSENTATA